MPEDKQYIMSITYLEIVEHGWRAVVVGVEDSTQLSAFVQYVDSTNWRIWAGRLFDTLAAAEAWCREEIATRLQSMPLDAPQKPWTTDKPAWRWLWETLETRIGEEETKSIRTEMMERLRER